MKAIPVQELKDNFYFSKPVFLDPRFILFSRETPVSQSVVKALLEWEFRTVYSDGEMSESYVMTPEQKAFSKQVAVEGSNSAKSAPSNPADESPVKNSILQAVQISADSDEQKIVAIQKEYDNYILSLAKIFGRYLSRRELKIDDLSELVRAINDFIKNNRRYVLLLSPSEELQKSNYVVSHSIRSTILALLIGTQMKFPNHKLMELGITCLVHEIGMIKLPPQLYMTDKPLNPQEKKLIFAHPILSYNILKESSFPLNICLGALEHHERINGTGYPRNLAGDKISIYAKIISVVCSYEALTGYRPYKEASDSYSSILELMRNTGKAYDESVIRALIFSISLYPIGLYVLLSNGQTGQVIDINPEDPKMPIIKMLEEFDATGKNRIIRTSANGIHISRPLTKDEGAQLKQSKQS